VLTRNMANYTTGVIRIKITGDFPEKFINLCLARGLLLWGIKKDGNAVYAYVRLPDFFKIRKPALKSRVKVRVIGTRGLPFALKRFKRRKMLLVGAVMFMLLLEVLTSYIWFVDIEGIKTISGDRIKAIAADHGLRSGAAKNSVKEKEIETSILLNVPEVAWVGVKITGTRAVVEIVEKTMAKTEDKTPADIVATKDGVITELIAIAGQAAVKKGDTVRRGDILIKGVLSQPILELAEQRPPVPQTSDQYIRANGIVKARVWYESYGEAGLVREEFRRTGRRRFAVALKAGESVIDLKKVSSPPFTNYETEVIYKKLPNWRNTGFAVETKVSVFYEVSVERHEISPEEALDLAKTQAIKAIESQIPENAQVLVHGSEVLNTSLPGLIRVKVSMETVEDIGFTRVTLLTP